jgi:DNA-binding NarL/FixJ family response regulator
MKKIGFISTNKVLAQSLATITKSYPEMEAEPFMMIEPNHAAAYAEALEIDVAVVDMAAHISDEAGAERPLYKTLRQALPRCRILLLLSQDDIKGRDAAMTAVREKDADDFMFHDSSLDYLFVKLLTLAKTQEKS